MQIAQCRAVSYGAIDQNASAGDNNGCPRLILAARVALSRPGDSYQCHVCGDPTTRDVVCRCSKASLPQGLGYREQTEFKSWNKNP